MTNVTPLKRKDLILRKDLEISDLLALCGEPHKIEDRVKLLQEYSSVYPELKYFLVVAYFCPGEFSELREAGPLDYQPSRVIKGSSVENLASSWREVTKLYDSFPSGPRVKRGRAQRLLSELHKDDAELFKALFEGKFHDKRLNDLVVRQAFPSFVPNQ